MSVNAAELGRLLGACKTHADKLNMDSFGYRWEISESGVSKEGVVGVVKTIEDCLRQAGTLEREVIALWSHSGGTVSDTLNKQYSALMNQIERIKKTFQRDLQTVQAKVCNPS